MTSGRSRIGALGGLLLAMLIVAGCERGAARDPLADTTATPRDFPAPTDIVVAAATSPLATGTPLPPATNTPTPTPIQVAVTPVPPTATPAATQPPGGSYAVKPGDRLFSIGRQFGVNPYSIAQANNIQPPYIIHPGDVLKIPGGGTTPTPGATPPGGRTHTVAPGENLFRISLRYGTTVQALAAANNITNINLIFVGQMLKIP